jgi:hypothetical protein
LKVRRVGCFPEITHIFFGQLATTTSYEPRSSSDIRTGNM